MNILILRQQSKTVNLNSKNIEVIVQTRNSGILYTVCLWLQSSNKKTDNAE